MSTQRALQMMRTFLVGAACVPLAAAAAPGDAQTASTPAELPSNGDPVLPPSLRAAAPAAAPSGAALQAVVEEKLRRRFSALDASRRGRIDREQALKGRWALLARHFDEIDVEGRGSVSFDDVMRYARQRRAAR